MNDNEKVPQNAEKKPPQNTDYITRPGGVFVCRLLMRDKCEMPSPEKMTEVMSKHLGNVDSEVGKSGFTSFAALDYMAEFSDRKAPVMLSVSGCEPFDNSRIDDFKRSQMWDCREDRERILSECGYCVIINDLLGGAFKDSKRGANMLADFIEAAVELFPTCEALYMENTGKLIKADVVRSGRYEGLDRYIGYFVNVRFFNIEGTQDSVIDTLGLSLLYIEDLQYHFHTVNPDLVVNHAYNFTSYILKNDKNIKDSDTIDGITDGKLDPNVRWLCRREVSLVQPERMVIDVNMKEYAAGNRE